MFPRARALASFALSSVFSIATALAQQPVYSTDFNAFPTGDDTVVGTDGWNGNNTGLGVHGTGEFIVGLGQSVYLGGVRPASNFTTLFRTVNYDALGNATPIVTIDVAIGIQDSTNGRRDSFFLSIYNSSGQFLAALQFDNTETAFGLWRNDGTASIDTGAEFVRNEIMLLTACIDLAANTWSVFIDNNPSIFEDAPFNTTGGALDLGSVAFEWQLTGSIPGAFGNNFMLFDELDIEASAAPDPGPFVVTSIESDIGGTTITWVADPGFTYQVEYSSDLAAWEDDLPGSSQPSPISKTSYEFTDPSLHSGRYYRVVRTADP